MHPSPAFRDLDSRFKWLTAFFRSYYCFFALHPLCAELDGDDDDLLPFRHLSNVLLYDTIINWCKIFGVDSEDCHWKRLVKDHDAFRGFLFQRLRMDRKAFGQYQASILEFRNKWVVHFDPQYDHSVVPKLEVAHESAIALHEYLRQSRMDGMYYNGPESMPQFGSMVASKFVQALLARATDA
jgi:hypothetical protein